MKNHLSRAEFVDLLDGTSALPADRIRHAEQCERCRSEAEMLRLTRSMAASDDIPEPSPLFWDHFSARVADQVRQEPAPVPERHWTSAQFAAWGATAAVLVVAMSITAWRTTLHAPAPHAAAPASVTSDVTPIDATDDVDQDEAWAVVRAAAADLAWEDAHDEGITAHPDEIENEALQLNAAERRELARLLDEDLKRNGA